jgi:hypothetical protein
MTKTRNLRRTLPMLAVLIAGLHLGGAAASETEAVPAKPKAHATRGAPDSRQMEYDLQQLEWPKFRQVVESVPKLKADVDAYGRLGWKYVEVRYRTYPWQKSIDRLDDSQKRHLAELIRQAQR